MLTSVALVCCWWWAYIVSGAFVSGAFILLVVRLYSNIVYLVHLLNICDVFTLVWKQRIIRVVVKKIVVDSRDQ